MDSSQGFKSMQEKIQAALVKTTRISSQIAAEDVSFHRSSNPAVDEQLDDTSDRLLTLSASLLKSASKGTDLKVPDLDDVEDVDAQWSRVVDVIDSLLEKADTCLDEYTGRVKRKAAPTEEVGSMPKKSKTFDALEPSMRRANILKPQNVFEVKPDNVGTMPWKPLLTKKPHALLPLEKSIDVFNNEDHNVQYKHPYETEILSLRYPETVYQVSEPTKYQPVETTVATFVDSFEGVLEMLSELKKVKEIAIDTEHHDFRTYNGLLSLMQISTRDKDWIVDTLQPWRHKLEVLNEVFADPSIIKVLHGAYMDIIWLQRDCGLYIVGLFDTFHAAESLGYSARSLAYLLKRFVDFDADKKYQLADWRIRPIPEEMFYYARSDTHYLLYIYDMIRNDLNERSEKNIPDENYMEHVLERSKETSLRRYEKFVYDVETGRGPLGWFNPLMKQSSGNFSREQFAVFRAVHKWRDDVARREDESPVFIMGNASIFDIARRLPPDPKALHSMISQSSYLAKKSVSELFKVVDQAKIDGANGPTVSEFFRDHGSNSNSNTLGIGAVAQQVFPQLQKLNSAPIRDTKELTAVASRLWGQVPISSRWEATSSANGVSKAMQFTLPWVGFIEHATVIEPQQQSPAQPPVQIKQQAAEPEPDEAFTLKAGVKRKAPDPNSEEGSEDESEVEMTNSGSSPSALPDDEISVHSSSDEEAKTKAQRKAEKKEHKERRRAKKQVQNEAREAAEAAGKQDDEDEKPFDYTKAKSVLKAERGAAPVADNSGKGGKAKVFNPYAAKAAEGPKPARRMHGEKPGKSATFKSV